MLVMSALSCASVSVLEGVMVFPFCGDNGRTRRRSRMLRRRGLPLIRVGEIAFPGIQSTDACRLLVRPQETRVRKDVRDAGCQPAARPLINPQLGNRASRDFITVFLRDPMFFFGHPAWQRAQSARYP